MSQLRFDPATYDELMAEEVPGYPRLQASVRAAAGSGGRPVRRILDLGTGTGVTARAVLAEHPGAALVGVDESDAMLAEARRTLPPTPTCGPPS
jgi:tRNA (cmo5U34)-methyltransferase